MAGVMLLLYLGLTSFLGILYCAVRRCLGFVPLLCFGGGSFLGLLLYAVLIAVIGRMNIGDWHWLILLAGPACGGAIAVEVARATFLPGSAPKTPGMGLSHRPSDPD
jgi:hypothetical protein